MNQEELEMALRLLTSVGLKIVRVDYKTGEITVALPPTRNL